jgi:hypothetical protein
MANTPYPSTGWPTLLALVQNSQYSLPYCSRGWPAFPGTSTGWPTLLVLVEDGQSSVFSPVIPSIAADINHAGI